MLLILSSAILLKWIKWNQHTSPVLMRYHINFILKENATICFLLFNTTIYSKYHIYAQMFWNILIVIFHVFSLFLKLFSYFGFSLFAKC